MQTNSLTALSNARAPDSFFAHYANVALRPRAGFRALMSDGRRVFVIFNR